MAGENAAKRARLFDLYVNQAGHEDMTQGQFFFCPLCRRPFEREATAGDNPKLTLAHIIPECLGGTLTTLACAECNNGHGHKIEADFLASHKVADWVQGKADLDVRMGETDKVRALSRRDPATSHLSFNVTTPMINPAVPAHQARLTKIMRSPAAGENFKITFRWFRPGWCRAAVCQSAYLLMFRYFGYDFARNERYNFVREQVIKPDTGDDDRNIVVLAPEVAEQFLEGNQASVVFIREPMRAILAVLRFRSPGGIDQFLCLAMPGPDEPPLSTVNLDGAIYVNAPEDPEFMKTQQGSLWLAWHWWLNLEKNP